TPDVLDAASDGVPVRRHDRAQHEGRTQLDALEDMADDALLQRAHVHLEVGQLRHWAGTVADGCAASPCVLGRTRGGRSFHTLQNSVTVSGGAPRRPCIDGPETAPAYVRPSSSRRLCA